VHDDHHHDESRTLLLRVMAKNTYMHTHTRTRTHMHTHTHTRMCVCIGAARVIRPTRT
jgi:hypothetical protein